MTPEGTPCIHVSIYDVYIYIYILDSHLAPSSRVDSKAQRSNDFAGIVEAKARPSIGGTTEEVWYALYFRKLSRAKYCTYCVFEGSTEQCISFPVFPIFANPIWYLRCTYIYIYIYIYKINKRKYTEFKQESHNDWTTLYVKGFCLCFRVRFFAVPDRISQCFSTFPEPARSLDLS